jgi:predicted ATPase/class 3 adenylate cyclase
MITTFLFTDIEGSSRLWEQQPGRMQTALAQHDMICRAAVEANHGIVAKMTGDGMCAAFDDPVDALKATLALQTALVEPANTHGIALRVRCGMDIGVVERRDNDYFGNVVNRAARIMSCAHGGQILLSQAVANLVIRRLPDGMELLDLGSIRLRDLAQPERVFQVAHPALRRSFPALRSLVVTPNNLPQQVTSFIGRDGQMAEIKAMLSNSRLLTLLGMGGLGKTRLSLQVAADVIDDYPDGVWFVELAPLADGQRVALAVASVLGVKEEPGHPVQDALAKYVEDRNLLLVLDNCEHLLDACAALVSSLLQAGPRLKVLATSREPLRAAGEVTYHVPALAVPELHRASPLEALTQYDSVRLFSDRAAAMLPDFQLTDGNATAVAAICHCLDGIPLALELAAARVRNLPVETIAERLSDRFRVLTGGSRTVLPRQQTLRACIDWSYNLLTEPERALLRSLAVFAGGFTLEGAEAVGAGSEIDSAEVLDLLTQLVDKSLVEFDAKRHRYRLLETVRQYAHELLLASEEQEEAARTRHLDFYLALVGEADGKLYGPDQGDWLARLDEERENLLAAHAWCGLADARADSGLRLLLAVQLYWMRRGMLRLGHEVTVEALERPAARARSFARCRALYAAGNLGRAMGRYGEAQVYVEESLAIGRELGDRQRIAAALVLLGTIFSEKGELAEARRCYEESLALAEALGDSLRVTNALGSLGRLHNTEGDADAAEAFFERSLALSHQHGYRNTVASLQCDLALVSIRRKRVDRATALLSDALAIVEEIGSKSSGLEILRISAALAATRSEWERAARCIGASMAESRRQGFAANPSDTVVTPLLAQARSTLGEAAFAAAENDGEKMAYEEAIAEVRAWLCAMSPK